MAILKGYISETNPKVVELFRIHCLDGNSPQSFAKYLLGRYNAYSRLMKSNAEFKKLNDTYKTKNRRGVYGYLERAPHATN